MILLKNIVSVFFGDLLDKRNCQLNRYESQLNSIYNHSDKCPKDIIKFLLFQSKLNRIRTENSASMCSGIFDLKDSISDNLNQIDKDLDEIDKILDSNNVCKFLKIYLEKVEPKVMS